MEPTTQYLTYNREIDVLDPDSFVPTLRDVFRALPKINRFNGQTSRPYSVATHSIACTLVAENVCNITKPHLLLAILLHDAAEAYIGDIVRPIKYKFHPELHELEDKILHNIYLLLAFNIEDLQEIYSEEFQATLREIDTRMAATEADVLRDPNSKPVLQGIKRFDKKTVLCPGVDGRMLMEMVFDGLYAKYREATI